MAFKQAPRTRQYITSTGEIDVAAVVQLGGVTNIDLNSFVQSVGTTNQTAVCIVSGNGVDWQECKVTVTDASPDTLTIDEIVQSSIAGVIGTDPITLTGTSRVFGVILTDWQKLFDYLYGTADGYFARNADNGWFKTSQGIFSFARVHTLGGAAFVADNYTGFLGDLDYAPGSYGAFEARFARGTEDDPRYPLLNDLLGGPTMWGWDENLNSWRNGVAIVAQAAANWSDTTRPARLVIQVIGPDPAGDLWNARFNPEFYVTNGGLTATTNVIDTITTAIGSTGQDGARFYFEITNDQVGAADFLWGVALPSIGRNAAVGDSVSGSPNGIGMRQYGGCKWRYNGTETANGMAEPSPGDVIGLAFDLDLGRAWVRNVTVAPTVWYGDGVTTTPNPATGTGGFLFTPFDALVYIAFTSNDNGTLQGATMNAGATPFEATLPATFLAFDSNAGALNSIIYWEDGGISLGGIRSMGPGTLNVYGGYYIEGEAALTATTLAGNLPEIAGGHVLGNSSGVSAVAADTALSDLIDAALGNTRGSVIIRGSTGWAMLTPGTDGYVLTSQGSGADPDWEAPSGGAGLPSIANGHIIGNSSGSTATAGDVTLTSIIDIALGNTRGALAMRGASGWTIIAPGTSGYALLSAGSGADPAYGAVLSALPTIADGHLIGNASGGSAAAADTTLTALIDAALGSTRGSILYRGASGWAILAPGTSGNFLKSNGSGADPAYAAVSASLPTIGAGKLLGNSGGSSATAAEVSLTAIIDQAIGNTRGSLLRRGASGWELIIPGTSGHALISAGTGADPVYGQVRLVNRGTWANTNNYSPSDLTNYLGGIYANLIAITPGEQWSATYDTRFTITNGGLTATTNVNNQNQTVISTIGRATGKWYFEFTNNMNGDADLYWGLAKASHSNGSRIGNSTDSVSYHRTGASNGNMVFNNSESNCGFPKPANGSVIGMAVDLDNGLIWVRNPATPSSWFGNNGASPDPVTGTNGFSFTAFATTVYLAFSSVGNGATEGVVMNAGASAFVAAAPTGFTAWNTNAAPLAPSADTTNWKLVGANQVGVTDASSAAAGYLGEELTGSATAVSMVNATAKTVVTLSVTAGDWDVEGIIKTNPAGTTTISLQQGGISTTDNTLPAALAGGRFSHAYAPTAAGIGAEIPTGSTRISVSATTNVRLVAAITFATSTLTCDGYIRARRVR